MIKTAYNNDDRKIPNIVDYIPKRQSIGGKTIHNKYVPNESVNSYAMSSATNLMKK